MKINSTSIAAMSSESTFICPYNSPGTIYNMYVMSNHFTCSAFQAIQDARQVANVLLYTLQNLASFCLVIETLSFTLNQLLNLSFLTDFLANFLQSFFLLLNSASKLRAFRALE